MAIFYDEEDFLASDLIVDALEDDEEIEDDEDSVSVEDPEEIDKEEENREKQSEDENNAYLDNKELEKDLAKTLESKRSLYKFSYKGQDYIGKVLKKIQDDIYIFEVRDSTNNKQLKKVDIRYASQKD